MTALHKEYPVEALAQALEVSPSGYYSHQHKDQRPRAQQDRVLEQQIQQTFQASRATYGAFALVCNAKVFVTAKTVSLD